MFQDREDGARQLANLLRYRQFHDPLVLAIPRGGVVTGAVLARELGAELDVVLARKLRAPNQSEAAIGAIGEDGFVYLNTDIRKISDPLADYLADERAYQTVEIQRRAALFREVRPRAKIAGRSVIVTDDGIATGSTMVAALHFARAQKPRELIVAVPVASPDRLEEIRRHCDEALAFLTPPDFWAVGQYYDEFGQVEDDQVVEILKHSMNRSRIRSGQVSASLLTVIAFIATLLAVALGADLFLENNESTLPPIVRPDETWVRHKVGDLSVSIPESWKGLVGIMDGEASWYLGEPDEPIAIFNV